MRSRRGEGPAQSGMGPKIDIGDEGKPMRPDVAIAFDRMAATARSEAGLHLSVNSGFRSDAEQARVWAAKPKPHLFFGL